MDTGCTLTVMPFAEAKLWANCWSTGARWASVQITRSVLGSRTGGALDDEEPAEDGAAEELEPDADGEEAGDADDAAEFEADFEDELEQPVRERAAATTATAAVVKEGRNLTMTPLVSGCGKGREQKAGPRRPTSALQVRALMAAGSGRDSLLTRQTLTGNSGRTIRCSFLRRCFRTVRVCFYVSASGPVDARTTNSGKNSDSVLRMVTPRIWSISVRAAATPIDSTGWRTVVSGGSV